MAGFKVIQINVGDRIFCDDCGDEYTGKPDKGGILFETKSICPKCAPALEESALRYNEVKFIRARAEHDETFAAFVLRIRKSPPPPVNVQSSE